MHKKEDSFINTKEVDHLSRRGRSCIEGYLTSVFDCEDFYENKSVYFHRYSSKDTQYRSNDSYPCSILILRRCPDTE